MSLRAIRRFPWITAGLAAVCALATLVPPEMLQYDRARVEAGELWRLFTGQMVHWTLRMALLDLGMLLGLGAWLEAQGDRQRVALALLLSASLTVLAVAALSPCLSLYRGSSGMASALFVGAALRISKTGRCPRLLGWTAILLFLGKAAFETLAGKALFAGPLPDGVEVVPLVHLLGGMGGMGGIGGARVNAVVFRANPR
jgi:rhomboid family GlyGly-CTERM serine protease